MDNLVFLAITFAFVFLVYIFIVNKIRLRKKNYEKIGELNYLISKFNLDRKKVNYKDLANVTALINSFIIAFTAAIILLIPLDLMLQMLIGFVILVILIYGSYEVYGKWLIKKGLVRSNDKHQKN